MKFRTTFEIPQSEKKISLNDKIISIGSCFAENISKKLEYFGYNVINNPFGIIYNPLSVCNSLNHLVNNKSFTEKDLHKHNEIWHSWDHHSRFSSKDIDSALENMNEASKKASTQLKNADWLIITLGSSFTFYLKNENKIVNNCHKHPADKFTREMSTPEKMLKAFESVLPKLSSETKIILTISPVRYIRDGFPENQSSKARLFYLKDLLKEKYKEHLFYFPSYELMMDDLRDYRFYNEDMLHPNDQAIDYIWQKFSEAVTRQEDKAIIQRVDKLRKNLGHRALFPNSEAHKLLVKKTNEELTELKKILPHLSAKISTEITTSDS